MIGWDAGTVGGCGGQAEAGACIEEGNCPTETQHPVGWTTRAAGIPLKTDVFMILGSITVVTKQLILIQWNNFP